MIGTWLAVVVPLMALYMVLVVIGDLMAGWAGVLTAQMTFLAGLVVVMRRMSR